MQNMMVSVICTAYNHEQFIREALEGFVNQKTDFEFEVLVHDDASADGTATIIKEYEKEYPHLIRAIYQTENQFSKCHLYRDILFPLVRGKYIAFCEGDDYWNDINKLQKQVDFMEAHENCSLCLHNAEKYNWETGERQLLNTFPKSGFYSQEEQIKAGLGSEFPAFASYLFRSDLLKEIPDFFFAQAVMDYPIRQYLAQKGSVYYFQEAMSVYRVSTPNSYMKKTAGSMDFYNNYTIDMIRFFENLDQYTEGRFHECINTKIVSDYYGFCASVDEKSGIEKASRRGIDVKKVKQIFKQTSENDISESMMDFICRYDKIYIFGTSRLAAICAKKLQNKGCFFEGYVVSDGQMKSDSFEKKPVIFLGDFLKEKSRCGLILAIQPVNAELIAKRLEKMGFEEYFLPFLIDKEEKE